MKRSTDRCHTELIHVDGSTKERTHKPLKQNFFFLLQQQTLSKPSLKLMGLWLNYKYGKCLNIMSRIILRLHVISFKNMIFKILFEWLFLEQDTLPLLHSTGWSQERILAWFHNRTKMNWGPCERLTLMSNKPPR